MAKLTKKQILALSEEERKRYYADLLGDLRAEEKAIKKELDKKKQAEKAKNRSKVNHAKYVIAGEFLESPEAKDFLTKLSKSKKYSDRTANGLNLLMRELGLDIYFQSNTIRIK